MARVLFAAAALGGVGLYIWRHAYSTPLAVESMVLPILILAAAVASRLRPAILIPAFLISASSGIALIGLNLGLEFFGRPVGHDQAARVLGQPFDHRTRLEVIDALAAQGIESVPPICPIHFLDANRADFQSELIPLSGIPNMLTVNCNESGEYATYVADRQGFNNPDSIYDSIAPTVALLGDSFVHGACVRPGEDIGSVLRKHGIPTIALGCGGNGPLSVLATYREYAAPLNPGYAVWMYYEGNDLHNLQLERESPLISYLEPQHRLGLRNRGEELQSRRMELLESERGITTTTRDTALTRTLTLYHLRRLLGLSGRRQNELSEGVEASLALMRQILRIFADNAKAAGTHPLFVYVPSHRTIVDSGVRSGKGRYGEDYRENVLSIVQDVGLELLDLEARMLAHPDPISLFVHRLPAHFTPEGYEFVANAIREALEVEVEVEPERP